MSLETVIVFLVAAFGSYYLVRMLHLFGGNALA